MIEEMNLLVRENVKSKNLSTKHLGNLRHYEVIKPKNNKNKGKKRIPAQRPKKIFSTKS